MTEKLFENDSFLTSCKAKVLSCRAGENGFEVILDKTVFFPEGGGQPADKGKIGSVNVNDVQYVDGEIVHYCDGEIAEGAEFTAEIDFDRRLDHIQQHTGEHMLSYAFWKLFGAANKGFHMSDNLITIDLDCEFTPAEIAKAEKFANRQIYENLPIKCYYTTLSQLKNRKVRKISEKAGENPRIVEMVGGDICTCCGTAADCTARVGIIKIIHSQRWRGGTRIDFLCGGRAFDYLAAQSETARLLANDFSTEFDNLPERIKDLKSEISELRYKLKEKSAIIMDSRAAELAKNAENGLIISAEENISPAEAQTLVNRMVKEKASADTCAVIIFADREAGRINYLCAAADKTEYDCKYFCELLNSIFNGRGGGSKGFARGGGNYCPDWQERTLLFKNTVLNNIN